MSEINNLSTKIQERFHNEISTAIIQNNELTLEIPVKNLISVCKTLRDEPEFQFAMLLDVCGVDYLHYGIAEWKTSEEATKEGFSRGVEYLDLNSTRDAFSLTKTAAEHNYRNDFGQKYDSDVNQTLKDQQIPDHNVGQAGDFPQINDPATERRNRKMIWNKPRFAAVYHLLSLTKNHRIRLRCFAETDPPILPSVVEIWNSANWFEREAFDLFGIFFENHPDLRRILTDYGFMGYPFRKDFPLIGTVEMRYSAKDKRIVYEPVQIPPRTLVPKTIPIDHRYLGQEHV